MQRIAVADGTLAVVVEGTGPPLLFVHGFPLNHAMWSPQIAAFAKSHRVIVPDLRGFGESSGASDIVTMESFAEDVHSLLLALRVGQPIVFCGLSMGGYVAWQFFRKYRAELKALILCDTRAAADTPEAAAGRRKLAEKVLAEGPSAALDAMLPRLVSPTTVRERPNVMADLRAMILKNKPAGIAAALHGLADRPDCTALLSEVDVPTLLICGEDDQITPPSEMKKVAAAVRGARFVEIPAAGHMAPLENPAVVNRAISDFLAPLGAD